MERSERDSDDGGKRGGRPRLASVIAVALAAAFLVWLLLIRGDDGDETADRRAAPAPVRAIGPVEASESDLLELQGEAGHPIYWLGTIEGKEIELTRTTDRSIYVRYLDPEAAAGEEAPALTVSTYPFADAFGALEVVAERPGSISERREDGALVVRSGESATSAYVAWPDQDVQVEIFAPDPEQALDAATSERLSPIG